MKIVALILLTNIYLASYAQTSQTISVIEFVKIKNDRHKEAIYFYENNWKAFREAALQENFIKSYRLLTTNADSVANFDIILITDYADSLQFKLSEERFQKIIKEIRPNGPRLLNDYKPADFRQNVFTKRAETVFISEKE